MAEIEQDLEIVRGGNGRARLALAVPGTTGHLWIVESSDGLVFEEMPNEAAPDADLPIGGPSDMVFMVSGTGTAVLVLKRPWEDGILRRVKLRTV